ncbi:unnamed protein product [Ilex paraguariensis]|uniref:Uncharacterized protein n=1 Tax=Ilex paraguariensis TaxID=185542 RepID=A0ABC8SJF2_9AQUA
MKASSFAACADAKEESVIAIVVGGKSFAACANAKEAMMVGGKGLLLYSGVHFTKYTVLGDNVVIIDNSVVKTALLPPSEILDIICLTDSQVIGKVTVDPSGFILL